MIKSDTPRPTFSKVFADTVLQEVAQWIVGQEDHMSREDYKHFLGGLPEREGELFQLLESMAFNGGNQPDSFEFGLALSSVLDWPVNGELISIFETNIDLVNRVLLRREISSWIMKTGTRFKHTEGSKVKFLDRYTKRERSGIVDNVDKITACASIVTGDNISHMVNAEDLLDV